MIGIYKITNPLNEIYIGQSVNIEKRFASYRSLSCKTQPKIYNSLKLHGVEKHSFQIIIECEILELNNNERYYQELYNSIINGLNSQYAKSSSKKYMHSEETKLKMSLSQKGKVQSLERRIINSKLKKGNKYRLGHKVSEQTKDKIRKANLGKKISEETKRKMSESSKLAIFTEDHRKKIRESKKGVFYKIILDTETGIYYMGYSEAAFIINQSVSGLANKLLGNVKNNTNLILV